MRTELLSRSAVIRTLGNCGPPDPPWPSALSSELSVATGTPPNCAAAPRGGAPSLGGAGLLEFGGAPPVSLSAAVIAFTPEVGAISLVGDSPAAAPPPV